MQAVAGLSEPDFIKTNLLALAQSMHALSLADLILVSERRKSLPA